VEHFLGNPVTLDAPIMASIREYFEKAFPFSTRRATSLSAESKHISQSFDAAMHLDFNAHAWFASVFFESSAEAIFEKVATSLIKNPEILSDMRGGQIDLPRGVLDGTSVGAGIDADGRLELRQSDPDGTETSYLSLLFTRRLYIYTDFEPPDDVKGRISLFAVGHGFVVSFRGPGYATRVNAKQAPVAFISHDSRDKAEIVQPLARRLTELLVPVWYDEYSLKVGDSLRESIERGLKTSRRCILVLTPNFLEKGGWPRREYDIAFTREILEDTRVLIPIWHGVTKYDVYNYSPILADRVATQWELGIDEVCRRLHVAIHGDDG
jgi:hypothetical protein